MEEQAQAQWLRQLRVQLHVELHRWLEQRQQRRVGEERAHRRVVMEEEEKRREEVTVMRQHKRRVRSSPSAAPAPPHPAEPAEPQWKRPMWVTETAKEAEVAPEEVESRKEERLRAELQARKSLERLLTQRTFLHLTDPQSAAAAMKQRRTSSPPLLPPLLPPLHPASAFAGEEEKTAITIHSPTSTSPAPLQAAVILRHPPLIVQGNPSLHSGWSWRPDLVVREIRAGISPNLPPSVVKRVREREGRGGMALSRGREEAEVRAAGAAVSASDRLWGAAHEEFELVGRKQRAFVKRRQRRQSRPSQRPSTLGQAPPARWPRSPGPMVRSRGERWGVMKGRERGGAEGEEGRGAPLGEGGEEEPRERVGDEGVEHAGSSASSAVEVAVMDGGT